MLLGLVFTFSFMSYSNNDKIRNEKTNALKRSDDVVKMQQPIKIVCIGNSITEGFGNTCQEKAWPGQLNKLLGAGYSVFNCAVSGTIMFKNSDYPYWNTNRFIKAKEANPQILIIALGTNDADPWRWNKLPKMRWLRLKRIIINTIMIEEK